jgi:hypothetical protein
MPQCYVYIKMPVFLSIIVVIRKAVTPVNEVHSSASESNTDIFHSTRHANNSGEYICARCDVIKFLR